MMRCRFTTVCYASKTRQVHVYAGSCGQQGVSTVLPWACEERCACRQFILAAGMSKRLKKLAANNTKCMASVSGVSIME